ncbi:uncharacterized protein B0I36DRAFT_337349 [Microdochium trichocladiopsis]|uniref:Kinesin light chain n=1 Tax=Microdochium trichocladiopsis TaxID=1682393 RepID=A0A9P9BMD7_9PEZI|nr:uncharacterized protein B0I36DRAFT_337349 [Microdochium trichocladiopsis]KAH7016330.1 hypothetical protein B0I36DRAFT_337349 [Microdochium trichocladiopsis]
MANLASTFWNQGRWDEAEKLEVEVMETRKEKFGPTHPDTLTIMNNLAFTWHAQGRITDAIDLLDSCVQLRRHTLGPDHPDTASSTKALNVWRVGQVSVS